MRHHRHILAATLLALAAPFAPAAAAPCVPAPGAICAGETALDEATLAARLAEAEIVVLGERHDNPVHHEWQARLVAALAPRGLAFEMVPRAREEAANAARASGEDLAAALDWANSGWPDWAMYAPIFEAAPAARIAGGGVARERLNRATGVGAAAAMGAEGARYRLDERLPQDQVDAMLEEQMVAHCNVLPRSMLPGMVEAQQLRDASFADAALRLVEAGHGPAVLITGNGHARNDRGAPLYLRRAAPAAAVLSVGMVELGEGDAPSPGAEPFDFVIYTPPHDRGDPCAEFIKSRQGG